MNAQEILDGFFEWLGSDSASDAEQPDTRAVLQAWREMKVDRARTGFQLRKALKARRETQTREIAAAVKRLESGGEVATVKLSGKIYPGSPEWDEFVSQPICAGERLRMREANIEH